MVKRKRSITETEVPGWAEKHPKVKMWLAKMQKPESRGYFFAMFCEWAELTPEQLYALKDDRQSLEAEYLLDKFVAEEKTPFPDSVKWQIIQAVKSFFSHHYRDLAKKAGKMYVPKKKAERKPKKEELKRLWEACRNRRDRALILAVNSTALAKGTLAKLTWGDMEEGWEKAELPCINVAAKKLKGSGVGKWENVRQITFLTPEAKKALIEYKEWIEKKLGRKLGKDDHVWLDTRAPYKPLSYSGFGMLVWRLAQEADVEFSWHDARRYVETALEEQKINPNWLRKIRGRKVRGEEAPYSKPAIKQLRAAFKEAVPSIQFLTEAAAPVKEPTDEEVLEALKNASPEQRAAMWATMSTFLSVRRSKRLEPEVAKLLKELVKQETATNGGSLDCQRIVTEQELPSFLAEGWRVAAILPSGKVVVSNGT